MQLHCRAQKIDWFASCWDLPSLQFIESLNPCAHKVASPCLTDHELLHAYKKTNRKLYVSTGMSTLEQIDEAMDILEGCDVTLMHSTSAYPCPPEFLNLRCIPELQKRYRCEIGYSGHEEGIATTIAAVALGASVVERHITLDRDSWGTDQHASVGPHGLHKLVQYIRDTDKALGDGNKVVYDCERPAMEKLRRVG